jgi:hypothetical protein
VVFDQYLLEEDWVDSWFSIHAYEAGTMGRTDVTDALDHIPADLNQRDGLQLMSRCTVTVDGVVGEGTGRYVHQIS